MRSVDWSKKTANCGRASAGMKYVWRSEAMRRVMAQVTRVAAGESRVCILGETGTGKELIARAVHEGRLAVMAPSSL